MFSRLRKSYVGWHPVSEWLLVAMVFLLPWQARWIWLSRMVSGAAWEYGTLSIYATEALLWACLISAFATVVRRGWRTLPPFSRKRFLQPSGLVFLGAIVLVVFSWLSLAWAIEPAVALQAAFRLTEAVAFFYLLLLARPVMRQRAEILWVIAAGLQGVLAVLQFFSQHVWSSTWLGMAAQRPDILGASVIELSDGRWLRAYGTFPHPNILAGFLALGILLAANWYRRKYFSIQRVAALGLALLASVGLVLTFSRAGMVAVLVGLFLWLVATITQRQWEILPRVFRFAGVVTLVLVATAVIVSPLAASRVRGVQRLEVKSATERYQLLREGLRLARQSWFFGVGIGNETAAVLQQRPMLAGYALQPVHNVALLTLVEIGVVGLLALGIAVVGLAWLAVRQRAWIGSSIIASLAILGWWDHYLWSLYPGIMMLWVGLAITAGSWKKI